MTDEQTRELLLGQVRTARDRITELEQALTRIAYMRPAGDINAAKNIRALVEQMEKAALSAIHPVSSEG